MKKMVCMVLVLTMICGLIPWTAIPVKAVQKMYWPLDIKWKITTGYGTYPNGGSHNGVDMAATEGTPIYANIDGTATFYQRFKTIDGTKYLTDLGNCVLITSDDGKYCAVYGHMNAFEGYSLQIESKYTKRQYGYDDVITVGSKKVSCGDVIGYVGTTGYSYGNHLHYGFKIEGKYVDPDGYLDDSMSAYEARNSGLTIGEPVNIGTGFTALILNKGYWKTIENSYTEGDKPPVRTANENGFANQVWYFERQSDGSYKISSCYDGKYLDVRDAGMEQGTIIQTCVDTGSDAQKWYLIEKDGGFVIQSKLSGLVMDLNNNDPTNGNYVQTWPYNNTGAQIWAIYRDDGCKLSAPSLSVTASTKTQFTWTEVYGESRYDITIWKGECGVGDPYHVAWDATSGYQIQLPPGTYQAYVDAVNYYDCKTSNVITFTVQSGCGGNHSFDSWKQTKAPTCTSKGTERRDCKNCEHYETREIAAKGHRYVGGYFHADEDGHYRECDHCDYYDVSSFEYHRTNDGDPYCDVCNWFMQEAVSYTVSYNANGGSDAPGSQTKVHGTDLILTTKVPTGKGYTVWFDANGGTASYSSQKVYQVFSAWNTKADGSGSSYAPGGTYALNAGITLYAQWSAATLGELPTASRTGYYFLGWYDSPDTDSRGYPTGKHYSSASDIALNITLYAVWIQESYLLFGDADRDGDVDDQDLVIVNNYRNDNELPDYDSQEFFLRCDLDRDGDIDFQDMVAINRIKLDKATQEEQLDGYSIFTSISAYPKTTYQYGEVFSVEGLEIEIVFFDNISFDEICCYNIANDLIITGYDPYQVGRQTITVAFGQFSTTFTVEVILLQYTISYDANGGNGAPGSQTKTHDVDLVLSAIKPTRAGFTFMGWSTSSTASSATYQPGVIFTANADTILYAVWKKGCENDAHTYSNTVITSPTCTEQGYTTYTCALCGDSYVDDYVAALGHTAGEPVVENETENGYDSVTYCTVCGEELSREYVETPAYIPGDINGDGNVNNRDAARLLQYLAGWDVEVVEAALDANGDGVVNNRDAARILQYLAGWDVTLH